MEDRQDLGRSLLAAALHQEESDLLAGHPTVSPCCFWYSGCVDQLLKAISEQLEVLTYLGIAVAVLLVLVLWRLW